MEGSDEREEWRGIGWEGGGEGEGVAEGRRKREEGRGGAVW